jgi:hypothetical protein
MLRHVEGQRRLSDRGPCRQDHQVRRLEPTEQGVELAEPGRHAEDLATMLVQVFQPVVRLAEQDRQRLEAAIGPALADLEQDRLGPVDGDLRVVGLLVPDRRDLAGGADEIAQDRLALDDPAVMLGVHGGRHGVHERGEVCGAADGVELVAAAQLVPQGHQIDRLTLTVEREHRLVDVRVLAAIEVGGLEEVAHPEDGIGVDQDRAEHALLGLDRLWCQLVDAHRRDLRVVMACR